MCSRLLQVILDVVYSHTAEGNDEDPKPVSLRGIDNATYYLVDEFGQ
jgi:pullulanase/glycogen debranching enzyme